MQPVYCVIVGDEGVGKTSALVGYASNTFPSGPLPSTFDDYSCNVMVDGKPFKLTLHDTSDKHTKCDCRVDVFLVMFSVNNKQSFNNIKKIWKPWISQNFPGVPFILAGNKIDERDSSESIQTCFITPSEGNTLASDIGAMSYKEFSVKTQEGLRDTFENVILAFLMNNNSKLQKLQKKKKHNKSCTIL